MTRLTNRPGPRAARGSRRTREASPRASPATDHDMVSHPGSTSNTTKEKMNLDQFYEFLADSGFEIRYKSGMSHKRIGFGHLAGDCASFSVAESDRGHMPEYFSSAKRRAGSLVSVHTFCSSVIRRDCLSPKPPGDCARLSVPASFPEIVIRTNL